MSAKEVMPIFTMVYKHMCIHICICISIYVFACGHMYTGVYSYMHTHLQRKQLNYQADSFVHLLIQSTHIY